MGHIEVTLDTEKLRGEVGRGVNVYTNDPAAANILLEVKAVVQGSVVLLPRERLNLSNRRQGTLHERVLIRQELTETGTLQVTDVKSSVRWLLASVSRFDKATPGSDGVPMSRPGDWLLEVSVSKDVPYGTSQEKITFKTGLARQPEVEVPVVVDRAAPVQHSFEDVKLAPRSAGGDANKQSLPISIRPDLDPEQLRVEADPAALKVSLHQAGARFYMVDFEWDSDEPPHGSVRFVIGDEQVTIPIHVRP